jgi:hemerythrin-like domain-containing protein
MSSCHRRVEHFMALLGQIASGPVLLDENRQHGLAAALGYFRLSGARHTQDEEQSLHPRLRRLSDPVITALMARVDELEADHQQAETLHDRVELRGQAWILTGVIEPSSQAGLRRDLGRLQALYTPHIAFEDQVLYPAANQALSADDLEALGLELAARRGVDLAERDQVFRRLGL